jgi:hypothetical protein
MVFSLIVIFLSSEKALPIKAKNINIIKMAIKKPRILANKFRKNFMVLFVLLV